jgi:hypothetical protein
MNHINLSFTHQLFTSKEKSSESQPNKRSFLFRISFLKNSPVILAVQKGEGDFLHKGEEEEEERERERERTSTLCIFYLSFF